MTEENLTNEPEVDDGSDSLDLQTEIAVADAEREIDEAVHGHRGVARKYVRWVRRHNPDATPAELIKILERHYVTSISAAGAAITVGSIAAEIGIAMIPGVGAAAVGTKAVSKEVGKKATKEAAKAAAKSTMKVAAKSAAMGVAKNSAQKAAALLPAGDEQLQFETTTLFALAVADIHGLEYDPEQARALVYGLTNGRVSQQQIAAMATALAGASGTELVPADGSAAGSRKDLAGWANTLAGSLPGGAAQSLVQGIQTGVLENVELDLGGKKQSAVEYGVGALVGGMTRFVFGREVVEASHSAFADAPDEFPGYLAIPATPEKDDDESNRALASLEDAARSVGSRAVSVGSGVTAMAGAATRRFRSVDVADDGVPDEPQAVTAAKGVGGAVTGAAGTVGGAIASRFRLKRRGSHTQTDSPSDPEQDPVLEDIDPE